MKGIYILKGGLKPYLTLESEAYLILIIFISDILTKVQVKHLLQQHSTIVQHVVLPSGVF